MVPVASVALIFGLPQSVADAWLAFVGIRCPERKNQERLAAAMVPPNAFVRSENQTTVGAQ